jgi:UrcA family protein
MALKELTMRMFKRTALQVLPLVAAMMADCCIDSRTAAYAAPGRVSSSLAVSVKDLDLTTHAGAVRAYSRIRNAARSVCGIVDVFPEERAARDKCVDEAIASAVAKLGIDTLTDYYLAKTHPSHLISTGISAGR